jgi:broad specificity phosphatase PhoE
MEIYFIRHGESTANKDKIYQGWSDVHLSKSGLEQANKLVKFFEQNNTKFNTIYSSSHVGAIETAQPLLSCAVNNKIITKNNLRSINVGEWSGIAIDYVKRNLGRDYSLWKNKPEEFKFPGGESIIDVLIRAKCSLHTILDQEYSNDSRIAVVTHMITIKVLTLWMSDIDLSNIWDPKYFIPNTGLIIFKVVKLNNTNQYRFKRFPLRNPIPHLET